MGNPFWTTIFDCWYVYVYTYHTSGANTPPWSKRRFVVTTILWPRKKDRWHRKSRRRRKSPLHAPLGAALHQTRCKMVLAPLHCCRAFVFILFFRPSSRTLGCLLLIRYLFLLLFLQTLQLTSFLRILPCNFITCDTTPFRS